jgi:hypothetical protein
MRYNYTDGIISFELFGYNIEVAPVGGREWRLAIVDIAGSVMNKFTKVGSYESADYGDIPGTKMFWNFDRVPTLGEVDKLIREYKQNKDEHLAFMQSIGARC